MTLIDDWHEAYLKHYVVLLSPCLNVQLLEGNGDHFKVTSSIRQVIVGRRKGCMWGGLTSIFINILYENVWKSKNNLNFWSTSGCSTSCLLVTPYTCGIFFILTFPSFMFTTTSVLGEWEGFYGTASVRILNCFVRNGKIYLFTLKILDKL